MEIKNYLKMVCEEIHSTVIATLDEKGLPVTRVIDIMLSDDKSLYFLTAKGKSFYEQLMNTPFISISGITGSEGTMNKKAISIRGEVKNIKREKLDEIFKKNPYMASIYPTPDSRMALEVFQVHKGQGEFFDLSTKPITRASFFFGEKSLSEHGYFIIDNCKLCGECVCVCPQNCIELTEGNAKIHQMNCLHCGNCMEVCPFDAIEKR